MDELYQQGAEELVEMISRLNPRSLLLVGPEEDPRLEKMVSEHFNGIKNSIIDKDPVSNLGDKERYDLVYLYGLERYEKDRAMHLIASLRDIHAVHLFIVIPHGPKWDPKNINSDWTLNEMIACGLHLHRQFGDADRQLQMYRFELSDYKTTPDWLNSKYWANPELFDKYRW